MCEQSSPFGFINAFKPAGPTSTAFGSWVRRLLGGIALGHWGTLDPRACGVLPLAVGNASRLLPLLGHARKQYIFDLIVGARTDTADAAGGVVETIAPPPGWAQRLAAIVPEFIGPVEQMPPMFSSVKIGGQPLYKSARRNRTVERRPRMVHIYELRVLDVAERAARLLVGCDAGTYVRVLCEDLGARIGCAAHMGRLLRTASGPFALSEAKTPREIEADPYACLIDPLGVLRQPQIELDAAGAYRFAHGNDVALTQAQSFGDGVDMLVLYGGKMLGVGKVTRQADVLRLAPARVLAQAPGLTPSPEATSG